MSFREEQHGRVTALVDDTSNQFLIDCVGLQGTDKVISMDKSNENLQEFHHQAVAEFLQDFGIDQGPWDHIVLDL